MLTLPFVSYSDRFSHMNAQLRAMFPTVSDRVWDMVKADATLDHYWHECCYADKDSNYAGMMGIMESLIVPAAHYVMGSAEMGSHIINVLRDKVGEYVTIMEQVEYAQMEPEEQQRLDEFYESQEAGYLFQEKYDMYMNEY